MNKSFLAASLFSDMSKMNIQIGKDTIEGKPAGSNRWQFWLGTKQFRLQSSDAINNSVEVLSQGKSTFQGKQVQPNVWKAEHSFYGSSAWGSVSVQYIFEFNTDSMEATVKSETNTDA